jgi:hypothetical protein
MGVDENDRLGVARGPTEARQDRVQRLPRVRHAGIDDQSRPAALSGSPMVGVLFCDEYSEVAFRDGFGAHIALHHPQRGLGEILVDVRYGIADHDLEVADGGTKRRG